MEETVMAKTTSRRTRRTKRGKSDSPERRLLSPKGAGAKRTSRRPVVSARRRKQALERMVEALKVIDRKGRRATDTLIAELRRKYPKGIPLPK